MKLAWTIALLSSLPGVARAGSLSDTATHARTQLADAFSTARDQFRAAIDGHGGGAIAGAGGGLVCGAGILFYAAIRPGWRREDDPLVWRRALAADVIPAFLLEHGLLGAAAGSFSTGLRPDGVERGAALTCATDAVSILVSETGAARDHASALSWREGTWRAAVPIPTLDREGGTVDLLVVSF